MTRVAKHIVTWSLLAGLAVAGLSASNFVAPTLADTIKYVVDGVAVTSNDIQRRAAFLKLQRRKGVSAKDDMIEQTLRAAEMKRLNIRVTDAQVDASYARFAQGNKMTTKQMDGILSQAGVGRAHFKEYIRSQMGWGQALGMRVRGGGKRMSEQEMVRKMLERGGNKPSATEYMLQQVIFVVPAKERGALLGKRKREAEQMRARFNGCESTRTFAKGLLDVTVKDLGRHLEPALPPEWADSIKAAKNGATTVRETERGVEFIGICRAKEVSDDRVAQMLFSQEENGNPNDPDGMSKKYTAELREKAQIVER